MVPTVALAALMLVLLGLPVEAAGSDPDERTRPAHVVDVPPLEATLVGQPRRDRPAALVPLYVSFAALQGADLVLTRRALAHGAAEANPMMRGVVGSPAGFLAVKAGLTATTIFFSEKLRKRHPKGAVVLLIALDTALGAVVAHNAVLVNSLRQHR